MPDYRETALIVIFRWISFGAMTAVVAVAATACASHPSAPEVRPVVHDRNADREAIATLKIEYWRELYRNQDAAGLDAFLADDFVLLHPDGTVSTKQEEVEWLAANAWGGPEDFLYTIVDIVFAGDDAAIVYGHGDSTRTLADGAPCQHRYFSSNALVRDGGRWRPVFSHVSGVSCKPLDTGSHGIDPQ